MELQPEERELELQFEEPDMMSESDEAQGAGNKAWPLRQRAMVLVAGLAAVLAVTALATGFGSTGMQAVAPEPTTIEAINVLAPCKLAVAGLIPVVNHAISDLNSTYNNVITVNKEGPTIKIGCTAKTFLIFEVAEIQGLDSGVASASCNKASATLRRVVSANATASISFAKPVVFTMKLKEKASFCRIPKSITQKVTLTIGGLDVSTDMSVALKQGKKTKITAAAISDLSIKWKASDSGFKCKGSSCREADSWVENAIRVKMTNSLTNVIESAVNYQLDKAMPMTLST